MTNPITWLRTRIRQAGAYKESDTERDGFLSYATETHAVSYGLTLGFAIALATTGYPTLLMVVLAVYFGIGTARYKQNQRIFNEIKNEFQYFGPSVFIGFVSTHVLLNLPL